MTHDSKELLACPFCGGEDLAVYEHKTVGSWVACISCGLETPTETGTTPDDATKYWNTRPAPQPGMRAEGEAIKRAVCCPDGCQYEGDSEDGSRCYCDTSDYHGSGVEKRANAIFAVLLPAASPAEAKGVKGAGPSDCAEHILLQARRDGHEWINIYAAQLQQFAANGCEVRAIPSASPAEAGSTAGEYQRGYRDGFESAREQYNSEAKFAALRSASVSAPGTFEQLARHFETRKYGADRYLFPDEIASEIRQFAPAPAVGVTREAAARIIDPEAFEGLGRAPETGSEREYARECEQRKVEALTKANAIIRSPAPDATVSERTEVDDAQIAKWLSIIMIGDDKDAGGYVTKAHHFMSLILDAGAEITKPVESSPQHVGRETTVSATDPDIIIAGIKQFGLASDGSDLRDLSAAIVRIRREPVSARDAVIEDLQRTQAWLDTLDGVSLPSRDLLIAWYAERPSLRSAIRSLTGAPVPPKQGNHDE